VSKAPLSRITIRKYLYDGSPSYVWEGSVVESDAEPVVVEAYFQHARRDLGYVVFERGDVFVEFYYLTRWYNVFQIYSADGHLKGWYCNITKPAIIADHELHFVDLALDLFAHPDGRSLPLDVDEFEEQAASLYLPEDTAQARSAFDELQRLHRTHQLPSRPFPGRAS
jgi:protein associated with RNAse G/E